MHQASGSLRLSVVVNNHNYGPYVRECIQSVLNQSRPADEIIVVDDGSTDNSVEIIREFEGRVKLLRQENGGQLSAVMTGVKAADGDVLLFLDSDDMWKPHHLETVEKAFLKHPPVDCIFTSVELFGHDEGPHILNFREFPDRIKCSRLAMYYLKIFIGRPTSACAFRSPVVRNVLEACRGLEDDFRICADLLMVDGTSLIGAEKMFLDDCTVRYRSHGENGYFTKDVGKKQQELAARLHRRRLMTEKIQQTFPFEITPTAVMEEMTYNGCLDLYGVFYHKIPYRMKLPYLKKRWLAWRLWRLNRKLRKTNVQERDRGELTSKTVDWINSPR